MLAKLTPKVKTRGLGYNKSMILLLSFLIYPLFAQDEVFFRQLLAPEQKKENKEISYHWVIRSPLYQIDLDHDGLLESINMNKRDGQDWFVIYDQLQNKIHEWPLSAQGGGSKLYKFQLTQLSAQIQLGLLYFYEGHTQYLESDAMARVYFLTLDKKNLKNAYLFKGPQIFSEKKLFEGHYHVRDYQVKAVDFNGDGVKEIHVSFGSLSRVYYYQGPGEWKTF